MNTDLVVAGYIFNDDKVLLIHHRKLDFWLPVGGHIDPNETFTNAMIREAKEETNLDIEILSNHEIKEEEAEEILAIPFHSNLHVAGDHKHSCLFYVCRALVPEQLNPNKELKAAEWFSKEDLNKEFVPKDVKIQALKAFEFYEMSKV